MIGSYPKVYSIGHPKTSLLFKDEIVVQEKVDGSQFSFMKIDEVSKGVVRGFPQFYKEKIMVDNFK